MTGEIVPRSGRRPLDGSLTCTRTCTCHLRVGLLSVLATFLRFYHLDDSSLWSDEGNTWAMLSAALGPIAQAAAADIHPPGYYWALKLWTLLFGTSAFALRSFSAVAGVLWCS